MGAALISLLQSPLSRFFGRSPKLSVPGDELEHEVYLSGLWDPGTCHAPVEFVGSLEACEEFMAAQPRKRRQRFERRIRPTGSVSSAV